MKVLWVCNIMLPVIAEHLGLAASNKEGWLSGLADNILSRQKENGIKLGIAFPVEQERDGYHETIQLENGSAFECFGFFEDISNAESYEPALEQRIDKILKAFAPDVIHCFGTEYGHTLAVTKVCERPERVLVGIQGLCAVYANAYMASLPEKVRKSVTFRDWLKHDSLERQQQKFVVRGKHEMEAIQHAGNITGRTGWDRHYAAKWNPKACYYTMNETLRSNFYTGKWEQDKCEPARIFLSQGDYPLKGLHYMLLALPGILEKFPDARVCVAGNSLVADMTLKDKIKISAYGRYLRSIIRENHLEKHVEFLGRLTAQQMKEQYLRANVYVCCSTLENSPNSLGEAMLLGVPCVSADVGGIPSLFTDGVDGILFRGYHVPENDYCHNGVHEVGEESSLKEVTDNLQKAVLNILNDPKKASVYSQNARKHALRTHNQEKNYERIIEIYTEISQK